MENLERVIITGATGAIGRALINKCIDEGIKVTVLANPESHRLSGISKLPDVRIIKCGLSDMASADTGYIGNADAFFHLAWAGTFGDCRNDKELQDKNAGYAEDAVRLSERLGCKVFVGAGSQAEYGRVSGMLCADTPCNPENEYGRAKLRASVETRKLCNAAGIRHIWCRILSVYGPYDGEKTMIMSLISRLLAGEEPALTKGEQMWDYLYCDDAANAMLLLAKYGKDSKVYPLGSGAAHPLREYIETIRDIIDPALPLGFGKVPYSDKQVMHLMADISALKADTGFEPRVSFSEGIKRTIDYIKKLEH